MLDLHLYVLNVHRRCQQTCVLKLQLDCSAEQYNVVQYTSATAQGAEYLADLQRLEHDNASM